MTIDHGFPAIAIIVPLNFETGRPIMRTTTLRLISQINGSFSMILSVAVFDQDWDHADVYAALIDWHPAFGNSIIIEIYPVDRQDESDAAILIFSSAGLPRVRRL